MSEPRVAVLIPCLNERAAISRVVDAFRAALPTATIYVYDNNSTDDTAALARAAGALVRHEPRPGKGNVVRRMFQDIEADVYVMVDGDDTYDAAVAPALVARVVEGGCDMAVGRRCETEATAYRQGHRLGNWLLTGTVRWLFGAPVRDMLSGYRAFSRRFVKSFPSLSREFEIETELTIHAMQLDMAVAEHDTRYQARPPGSSSKLRTFRDGWRILLMIANLVRNERPLLVLGVVTAMLWAGALALGVPVVQHYLATGLVPRLPTAVLAAALVMCGFAVLGAGLVLDVVAHARREAKRLAYLREPAPHHLNYTK